MTTRNDFAILTELFSLIDANRLDTLAKETGFIQRKRNFTASHFLSLLFSLHGNLTYPSLQEICTEWMVTQGVTMSRAALDKKFTPQAVTFLQRVLQEILTRQQQLSFPALTTVNEWPFQKIRIIDSTFISIPNHKKKQALQTGQQSVKIHFEFDVLTGQITFFFVDFLQRNDAKMGTERIPSLTKGDLCLQDLGYMNLDNLKKIQDQHGFFLSKVRSDAYLAFKNPNPKQHPNGTLVESSRFHKIDLAALCQTLHPHEYIALTGVYFGRDTHFPARCIIVCHDEEVRDQHVKRIDQRTKRSGKKPKKVVRDLAGSTIYITNLPETISPQQICELYRLRWQIELHFKAWKSYEGMDHFKLMKKERWLCHLYGSLLICLLSQLIAYQLRNQIWKTQEKEVSEMVLIRTIANRFLFLLYENYKQNKEALIASIHILMQLIVKTAVKSKSTQGTAMKRLQLRW